MLNILIIASETNNTKSEKLSPCSTRSIKVLVTSTKINEEATVNTLSTKQINVPLLNFPT